MKELTITGSFNTNVTLITNEFIDCHMAGADGEFVKIYIFLLRHFNDSFPLTVSGIADRLNHTENDILRAFRYWESEGLLRLIRDENGQLQGINLGEPAPTLQVPDFPGRTLPGAAPLKPFPEKTGDEKRLQKQLKKLLFVIEQYLGKTLTKTDVDAVIYFRDVLDMSVDLIEYLVEYCVENGHKSIHYIQKVALSWHEDNVTTVEQARQHSAGYSKSCYTVLNAFGIKNRGPAASELAFIRKWTDEMGFSLELISEACDRTIFAAHCPSFEYADTILTKWKENNIHDKKDLKELDEAYIREKASSGQQAGRTKKAAAGDKNRLPQRSYDMESLEEQLLKSN